MTLIFLEKMLFLAILTQFWPVFDYFLILYGRQILMDSVFTTVLVRFIWKTQPKDNSGLQIEKKKHFYPKISIKMDFWKEGPKSIQKWRPDLCSARKNMSGKWSSRAFWQFWAYFLVSAIKLRLRLNFDMWAFMPLNDWWTARNLKFWK